MQLLIILSLVYSVFSQKFNDECICNQTETKCIPSISLLGSTLNLFNAKKTTYGLVAIDFTCDQQKTFYDDIIKTSFLIYDNMKANPVPFGEISSDQYQTSDSLAHSLSVSVGASGKYAWFEGSVDVSHIDTELITRNEFFLKTTQSMQIYEYALTLPIELQKPSEDFQNVVENYLPVEYDKKVYFDAIEKVIGTHVLVKVVVGGVGVAKTEVSYDYFSRSSETELKADAKIYFVNLKTDIHSNDTSESWKNNTRTTASVFGGDPQYAAFKDWDKWLPSIRSQPVQIDYYVDEVWKLIKDEGKQKNYLKALDEYNNGYDLHKVKNCTHFVIAKEPPQHTLNRISGWEPEEHGKPHDEYIYLVQGPDSKNRCLAAMSMRMWQKNPEQDVNTNLMRGIIKSRNVEVEGVGISKEGRLNIEITSNVGYCSGDYECSAKNTAVLDTISDIEQIHFSIYQCVTCWARVLGVVYQPYDIEDWK